MLKTLLGGLSPSRFLRDYWHKRPLLVRNAIPDFDGMLPPTDILQLARREDVESRLIQGSGDAWQLDHGPIRAKTFKTLPRRDWTLLVQSLNHVLPEADALLKQFDFIPHARLDDLMVSYAAPGGSVGPHVDSYDVFLLQGQGHRHWQISAQRDLDLQPDAPLKLLRDFRPDQAWTLGPGDMLYLPPHIAHHGVAETACTTFSIGFRAPATEELAQGFLMYLQDTLEFEGRYADPDLRLQKHPAEIGRAMLEKIETMIARIAWDKQTLTAFTGRYLSEPKPSVMFYPPEAPLSRALFAKRARREGVALDPKSRLLFSGQQFFINGEAFRSEPDERSALQQLGDARALQAPIPASLLPRLYDWYQSGWLEIGPDAAD